MIDRLEAAACRIELVVVESGLWVDGAGVLVAHLADNLVANALGYRCGCKQVADEVAVGSIAEPLWAHLLEGFDCNFVGREGLKHLRGQVLDAQDWSNRDELFQTR